MTAVSFRSDHFAKNPRDNSSLRWRSHTAVRAQEGVVVSYDGYAGFQGPLWAAKDLELFKKHGLNAEMVLITGSTRAMAALISGSTDFAQGSASASIPIRLRGGDIAIIAAALNKFPFSVVAQKTSASPRT